MLWRVLLINLIGLGLCSGYNPPLYLNIINSDIFICKDRDATVLEGEPLNIQVNNLRPSIKEIRCRRYDNNETFNTMRSFDSKNISVGNVTTDMGTVWNCTILTLPAPQKPTRGQTALCGNKLWCVEIDCKIQMHVRRTKAPQVILVNGMVLPSARAALDEPHDALAEYTFNDGDLVDVTCANPRGQNCHLRVDYNFSKNFPNISDNTFDRFTSQEPVGFRLRMGAVNDKTYAICMCYMGNDYSSVRVNFLMRNEPIANSVSVYINGAVLRTMVVFNNGYQAEYEYHYKPNEGIQVTCKSENGDPVTFKWLEEPTPKIPPQQNMHNVTANYNPPGKKKEKVSFMCKNRNKIKVSLMPRDLYETQRDCSLRTKLKLGHSLAKTSLDVNKDSKRYLIYEYNDGDSFDFTCTATCREGLMNITGSGGYIRRSSIDVDENSKSIQNISKSEIDKDNVYQCKQNVEKDTKLITTIVFIRNVPTTSTGKSSVTTTRTTKATTTLATTTQATTTQATTTQATTTQATTTKATTTKATAISTTSSTISSTRAMTTPKIETDVEGTPAPGSHSTLPVVSSVAGIVVMCVSAVIYKIRNRKNNRNNTQGHPGNGNVNYENLANGDGSPIPPFPSNWDDMYASPIDQAPESTYSEPCAGPTNIKPELYTLAVPKARRKQENDINEPAYVELDEGRPLQNTSNDYAEIGSVENKDPDYMYSEIAPKMESNNLNAGNMYSEITPKIQSNLNPGEYSNVNRDNPNYAQVVPKSMRRKREDASKYANVHDGRYVNANTGEYAEPAYCEPTYLNK